MKVSHLCQLGLVAGQHLRAMVKLTEKMELYRLSKPQEWKCISLIQQKLLSESLIDCISLRDVPSQNGQSMTFCLFSSGTVLMKIHM